MIKTLLKTTAIAVAATAATVWALGWGAAPVLAQCGCCRHGGNHAGNDVESTGQQPGEATADHSGHNHANSSHAKSDNPQPKAPHGGQLTTAASSTFEVVYLPEEIRVYLYSRLPQPQSAKDVTGEVSLKRRNDPRATRVACFSGCEYLVQPILYEGDVMGRVVFGPFVPEDAPEIPTTLRTIAPDFDEKAARGFQSKIRQVPMGTAEKILKHFMDLLDVMVFTGHKNLIAAKLHIEAVQESYRELQDKNLKLEESYAKLKELDRLKSNFLATMSHELRTPLTSVIGYSEMMLEGLGGPLTAEQREYLGIIMEKGESLLQLITSILDITKIEAGRIRLVMSDVDVGQLMKDAVATVLPHARKKGLSLVCEPGELPRVQCDREKIRQSSPKNRVSLVSSLSGVCSSRMTPTSFSGCAGGSGGRPHAGPHASASPRATNPRLTISSRRA